MPPARKSRIYARRRGAGSRYYADFRDYADVGGGLEALIPPGGHSATTDPDIAASLVFLPFISSAFVPTDTMPGPVHAFAEHQPVTSIVNAIRDLFTQQSVGTDIWIALAWCVGILIVAYIFAMATYRRRIS